MSHESYKSSSHSSTCNTEYEMCNLFNEKKYIYQWLCRVEWQKKMRCSARESSQSKPKLNPFSSFDFHSDTAKSALNLQFTQKFQILNTKYFCEMTDLLLEMKQLLNGVFFY